MEYLKNLPEKPLLIYDGDCGFCKKWISLWQKLTQNKVEYRTSQEVSSHFPQISQEQFDKSVVLITPVGNHYTGAEAVLRSLVVEPTLKFPRVLLKLYEKFQPFRWISEKTYSLIAENRILFSRLTYLLFGEEINPPTFQISRWIFLKVLALIYFIAFTSLGSQLLGLAGSQGIAPSLWSDGELQALWIGGVALSLLLMMGIAPAICLFGLWMNYLVLVRSCGPFLWFQWDALMLEMGFLAIFLAPWTFRVKPIRKIFEEPAPPFSVLFLFRWLLFRVVFFSGFVKLASGDPTWRDFTALTYHFETQPLPTWVSWYIHQLPAGFLKFTTVLFFIGELAFPFLLFLPKYPRMLGAFAMIGLQILIDLTGNYGFFGWQVVAMTLLVLDDSFWMPWISKALSPRVVPAPAPQILETPFKRALNSAVFAVILLISLFNFQPLTDWLAPYEIVNNYGVFAVMTTERDEIILEGSQDGKTWLPYEFKWKPGDLKRRPGFVEPHMPRLDWQMWFAALGQIENNPWLARLMLRLQEGSSTVLGLLESNPFPDKPPTYVRAQKYRYHFASPAEKDQWWKRDFIGEYFLQN
jgi:predicted DCC family thiol-disulfide oxidoreductase YuxK